MVVNIGSSYSKFLSPPVKNNETTKLEIISSITLHSMEAFDPVGGAYQVKFTVGMKWLDPRLTYNNLR